MWALSTTRITRLISTIAFCRNLIAKQCTEFSTSIGKVCFFIAWIFSIRSLFSVLPSLCLAELIAFCDSSEREHAFYFVSYKKIIIKPVSNRCCSWWGRLIRGSLAFVNRNRIMKSVWLTFYCFGPRRRLWASNYRTLRMSEKSSCASEWVFHLSPKLWTWFWCS